MFKGIQIFVRSPVDKSIFFRYYTYLKFFASCCNTLFDGKGVTPSAYNKINFQAVKAVQSQRKETAINLIQQTLDCIYALLFVPNFRLNVIKEECEQVLSVVLDLLRGRVIYFRLGYQFLGRRYRKMLCQNCCLNILNNESLQTVRILGCEKQYNYYTSLLVNNY